MQPLCLSQWFIDKLSVVPHQRTRENSIEMKDFVAIDFETANQYQSICSIGLVVVHNGVIEQKVYRLVRPDPNFYCRWATNVHGLTRHDTDDAPIFPDVWSEIAPLIGELPLVAHNSPFDEGCLRAAHKWYELEYPDYQFFDTLRASRRHFGRSLPNHQLHTVAAHCDFDLTDHHHALADAEACAHIALRIL